MRSLALLVVVVVVVVGEVEVVGLLVEVSEEVAQGIGLSRTIGKGLVAPIFVVGDGENHLLGVMYVRSQDKSWACCTL
jgi:hypothetical protein